MATKVCSKCKVEKDVGEFHARRASRDGWAAACKVCNRRWRQENPEKVREVKRRWRQENPEKVRDGKRRWYQANSEKILEGARRRRQENIFEVRAAARTRYRQNPDATRDRSRVWRAENPNRVREMNDSMSQTLDDNYVKTALRDRAATPELIEMKREQLMLYRLTKQLFETIKEVSGNESDRVDESPVGDGPEE